MSDDQKSLMMAITKGDFSEVQTIVRTSNMKLNFVDENGICIEEDYFENQDYDRIVNVSLVRDSGSIIVGQKNHVCKIDVEEEDNERTIPYAVRSSFLVMDDEIRNLDYD